MLANLIASRPRRAGPLLRDELRPGGVLLASGIFIDREPEVRERFRAVGLDVAGRSAEGRVGGARGGPALRRPRGWSRRQPAYNRRRCPPLFPVLLVTHIVLAVSLFLPSILLPFALRTRRAAAESPNRFVRFLLWMQAHGTRRSSGSGWR